MTKLFKFTLALSIFVPLVAVANEPENKHQEAEKKAVAAAEVWLAIVDQGDYDAAWESAAAYLKNAVSKDSFLKSLTGVRAPLGKVRSRTLKSKSYQTSLPGAPDGEYVVIQFETSFENKKAAVETITPMLDSNGEWRVSGYFIK